MEEAKYAEIYPQLAVKVDATNKVVYERINYCTE